jgi:hypothetical protein
VLEGSYENLSVSKATRRLRSRWKESDIENTFFAHSEKVPIRFGDSQKTDDFERGTVNSGSRMVDGSVSAFSPRIEDLR